MTTYNEIKQRVLYVGDKLFNIMLAHADGIYMLSARKNCDELASDIIEHLMDAASVIREQDRQLQVMREALESAENIISRQDFNNKSLGDYKVRGIVINGKQEYLASDLCVSTEKVLKTIKQALAETMDKEAV